jgi:hypothetical protein
VDSLRCREVSPLPTIKCPMSEAVGVALPCWDERCASCHKLIHPFLRDRGGLGFGSEIGAFVGGAT